MKKTTFKLWDKTGIVFPVHPPIAAKSVQYIGHDMQVKSTGKMSLNICPGMLDLKNQGWIIKAWDDIHIYASDDATMVYIGGKDQATRETRKNIPTFCGPMNKEISLGWKGQQKTLQPFHLESPWIVEAEDLSMIMLPAIFHSDIWDFVEVFPGIVDYTNRFNAANIIFAPLKTGTFHIKAGTPLIQLIPIAKSNFNMEYGHSQRSQHLATSMYSRVAQWYRKYIMKKTDYNVKEIS